MSYSKWRKRCIFLLCGVSFLTGCADRAQVKLDSTEKQKTALEVNTETVMIIEGESVTKEEYQMLLMGYTAQIKAQFSTDQANSSGFWEMQTESGTPLELAMSLVEEELIQKKTVAAMRKEYEPDIITDYDAIVTEMRQGTDRGYGLSTMDGNDYYSYVYAGFASDLMEDIKGELTITEDKLREYYEGHTAEYSYEHEVKVFVAEADGTVSQETMKMISRELEDWDTNVETPEEKMEGLKETYPNISFYCLVMNDLDTQEGKSGAYALRWIVAAGMQTGEVSSLYSVGDHVLCMRCLDQSEKGIRSFDEVEGEIEDYLKTEMARQRIQERASKASVVYDEQELRELARKTLES